MFRSPTFFSVLLVAGLTHAQPAAQPGGVEAAKRLFKEAVALEARSDWTNAERKLREALVVKDTPGLRYHLAFCQAQQGKLLEAQADYDRAQALIDGGMPAPDVQQLLTEARADVVRRISDLTLQVPARVPSFQVFIDGQQVQLDRGQPLRINPGSHQLELRAEGHRPFTTKVEMGEGDHRTLAIDPVPVAPPASAPIAAAPRPLAPLPPVAPPKRSAKPVVLIAEGALVAVGLGIGIWGLALRSSAADRRDSATAELDSLEGGNTNSACELPTSDEIAVACSDRREAQSDFKSATTLANVGFITAGIGAAAALGTFLFWPASADGPRRTAFGATIGPSAVYGSVRGDF